MSTLRQWWSIVYDMMQALVEFMLTMLAYKPESTLGKLRYEYNVPSSYPYYAPKFYKVSSSVS